MDETPKSAKTGRVRLLDIALEAGVSRATVSLAMRNDTSIPPPTRARIQRIAERRGYVYSRRAANLRSASTKTVGVVVHDITNPYFAEIIAAMQEEVRRQNRVVLFANTLDSHARQVEFMTTLREYEVDGIALCPAVDVDPDWLRDVRSWDIPVVLYSRNVPGVGLDYVGVANREGMREATEHLIALGHERIAMIGANTEISTGRERSAGYMDAMAGHGLDRDADVVRAGPATREFGARAIRDLLARPDPPTAAVCFNDVVGFGVMLGLRRAGREPGPDFSVAGFDNVAEAALWKPELTSVGFDTDEIGRAALNLLTLRAQDRAAPARAHVLPPTLIPRESSSPRGDISPG